MSAGKGSKPRPINGERFRQNYDNIFGARYPHWICSLCGVAYGRFPFMDRVSTWHDGHCDICGAAGPVTEPRDFGHLRKGWQHDA